MPYIGEVGGAAVTNEVENVLFEWSINDFFALSDKVDDEYRSPVFSYAESPWYLSLYPNGETEYSSSGWVGLYLVRGDSGLPITTDPTFDIEFDDDEEGESDEEEKDDNSSDIKIENENHDKNMILRKKDGGHGFPKFRLRSELQEKVSTLMQDKTFTITCELPRLFYQRFDVKVSWIQRVCKVSRNMKTILDEGKRSDFTLKLGDRDWHVHKVILGSRCEYFANMFRHDWIENALGQVNFEDIEEDILDNILHFIYTGVVKAMSTENVCEMYVAAHKFLLDDLKALCIEFMKAEMCLESVCKFLVIAHRYEERDLNERAIEYFIPEADKIFDTEEWKGLKKNHPSLVASLLEETTKRERKERMNEF